SCSWSPCPSGPFGPAAGSWAPRLRLPRTEPVSLNAAITTSGEAVTCRFPDLSDPRGRACRRLTDVTTARYRHRPPGPHRTESSRGVSHLHPAHPVGLTPPSPPRT